MTGHGSKSLSIPVLILYALFPVFRVESQNITIQSITEQRQSSGDQGYTLDGNWMRGARAKLLNTGNFGPSGTYPKTVEIFDQYQESGSLTGINSVSKDNIFFFGSFNILEPSTQAFTQAEVNALHNWSLAGGKMIICAGQDFTTPFNYNSTILNQKWGFTFKAQNPSSLIANLEGSESKIFNGPFGSNNGVFQGGVAQGYFSSLPQNSKILAINDQGQPTLFMDCNTLDLIIADVDCFTSHGGITEGPEISGAFANVGSPGTELEFAL